MDTSRGMPAGRSSVAAPVALPREPVLLAVLVRLVVLLAVFAQAVPPLARVGRLFVLRADRLLQALAVSLARLVTVLAFRVPLCAFLVVRSILHRDLLMRDRRASDVPSVPRRVRYRRAA